MIGENPFGTVCRACLITAALCGTVSAAEPAAALDAKTLDRLWNDLADSEGKASDAASILLKHPSQAVALIRERYPPIGPFTKDELREMVANLDAEDGKVRRKAVADVKKLGSIMEPYLTDALKDKPTLEMKHRCESLLKEMKVTVATEKRRAIWAMQLLEVLHYFGNSEAQSVLEAHARGHSGAYSTEEAKGALRRIKELAAQQP